MARVVFALAGLALVGSLATSSCVKEDKSTQITVALWSEAQIPSQLNAIEVQVFGADGELRYDQPYEVSQSQFFPTTLAIIPRDSDSLDAPVTIEVSGFENGGGGGDAGAGGQLLLRRAVVSFVQGRSLYLPMPLRMACFEQTTCNATASCIGGTCRSATVDSAKLVDYRDSLVFDTAEGADCFSEESCLKGAEIVAVDSSCTFPLPPGANRNVAIQWQAADTRIITLDFGDPVEGWTLDPDDSVRGVLSPGVCAAQLEPANDGGLAEGGLVPDKAIAAWVSSACAPKSPLQPYCREHDGSLGSGAGL